MRVSLLTADVFPVERSDDRKYVAVRGLDEGYLFNPTVDADAVH